MQLDQMWINPHTQDLYAEIIATEDIIAVYGTDCELILNDNFKTGEIK